MTIFLVLHKKLSMTIIISIKLLFDTNVFVIIMPNRKSFGDDGFYLFFILNYMSPVFSSISDKIDSNVMYLSVISI